ncbi:MAG: beta-lactamase family protein [Planctomycetes bacterium]|nr:beta-lactamase family protein [Planctomycetota bacterium]
MRLRLHALWLLLSSCAAPPPEAPPPLAREAVDSAVSPLLASGRTTGLAIGILKEGRSQVLGYGRLSAQASLPPDGDTLFEIGSITKTFTGILLLQQVAAGAMALDDPIRKHLPPSLKLPSRNGKEITLLHLATHRSGLPRLPNNMAPKDSTNPYADYGFPDLYHCLETVELARDPGEAYEYSNLGMGLLGHLLELKVGRSYEPLVIEKICRPLGMADTVITLNPDQKRRLAPGHSASGKPASNWDLPGLAGAGALRSTVNDMLRYLEANLGDSFAEAHLTRASIGGGRRIGLAWHLTPLAASGPTMVWHNGGTGGYRCYAGFVKSSRTAVVVLGNSTSDTDKLGVDLLKLLQDVK